MTWTLLAKTALASAAEGYRQIADKAIESGDTQSAMVYDQMAQYLENVAGEAR